MNNFIADLLSNNMALMFYNALSAQLLTFNHMLIINKFSLLNEYYTTANGLLSPYITENVGIFYQLLCAFHTSKTQE